MKNFGVCRNVWDSVGAPKLNSLLLGKYSKLMNDRLADIPSQIMKIIRMAAMVEIWAPKLDIKFQGENASG